MLVQPVRSGGGVRRGEWVVSIGRGVRVMVASAAVVVSLAGCAKVKVNAGPATTTATVSTVAPVSTTMPGSGSATSTTQPTAGGLELTTTTSIAASGGAARTTLVAPAGGSALAAAAATGDPCAVHSAVIALGPTADAATLSAAAGALAAVQGAVDRTLATDWLSLTRDFAKRAAVAGDLASQRSVAVDADAEAVELRVATAMDRDCPK